MNIPVYAIVIIAICFVAMFIFAVFIKRNQKFKVVGTMHIDMSREDKDICLFTLDMPLSDIQKNRYVLMKIDSNSVLKDWDK